MPVRFTLPHSAVPFTRRMAVKFEKLSKSTPWTVVCMPFGPRFRMFSCVEMVPDLFPLMF